MRRIPSIPTRRRAFAMPGGTGAPAVPGGVRGAAGAAALAAALLTGSGHAADQNPPTIKDLEQQQVDVNTAPPKNIDAGKTMDSYRRFLDLNAGDAALRAEALRPWATSTSRAPSRNASSANS